MLGPRGAPALLLAASVLSACAREPTPPRAPLKGGDAARAPAASGQQAAPAAEAQPSVSGVIEGEATYYSDRLAGRRTASGERYDPKALTAAHRTLPFGTLVRVVRPDSGQSVVVRVTDRGPFGRPSRIIDLSKAAARELDMLRAGVVKVRVEVLSSN